MLQFRVIYFEFWNENELLCITIYNPVLHEATTGRRKNYTFNLIVHKYEVKFIFI